MTPPLIITLPADDDALQAEIERELSPYGDLTEQRGQSFELDLNMVIFAFEIINTTASTLAILAYLESRREKAKAEGRPSGMKVGGVGQKLIPLEETDNEMLRRLLGV